MTRYIKYVTDEFLKEFKNEFLVKYAHLYKSNEIDKLKSVFSDPNHVIETSIEYEYEPLEVEPKEYDADIVRRNIRRVWESLNVLTPVQAEMEKIWVALAHTDYLEYQMGIFNSQIANPDNKKREESSLKSRTIFINGAKRSLAIHNLAILWWLAYYFRDNQNIENPYHLIDFFVSTPYRGNAVALLSSNIISNKEIALGILEAVKVLQDAELEELLKWRLYLAVMDVVRKCYKRRDAENFRCYYQKLKQIGTVRTFGESGTEKIRRLVWSVLFRLRVL